MAIMTLKSDEARIRMRDILDEAVAGREVLIQRYDKPVAVVVLYEQWKALKIAEAYTEAKQILAKIQRGIAALHSEPAPATVESSPTG